MRVRSTRIGANRRQRSRPSRHPGSARHGGSPAGGGACAVSAPFPDALDPRLRQALQSRGIDQLYTHQAAAIDHALAGRNVVVITPTASGKTLGYNAPILNAILQDRSSRALYLFPTKALAQDQLAELQAMCETIDRATGDKIGVFTYDGDTPQDARRTIRSRAHLVLSNPDMVHSGILPHHPRWAKLFENLRYVVIDELHAYRGVFGSLSATSCAGFDASAVTTDRIRSSCVHRPRSRTRASWPSASPSSRSSWWTAAARRAARSSSSREPAGRQPSARHPPLVSQRNAAHRLRVLKRNLQLIVFAQSVSPPRS